jgi:hypothetical protein
MTGNDMQSILNVDVSVITLAKIGESLRCASATFLPALI